MNDAGGEPAVDFIMSLDPKPQMKVLRMLDAMETLPGFVHRGYLKKLSGCDGLWEVRIDFANLAFRLLGTMLPGDEFLLVTGVKKKAAQLPAHEVELAQSLIRRYKRAKGIA